MMTSWLCYGFWSVRHQEVHSTDTCQEHADAAYGIAMALCKHIPLLINRDDIQDLVGEYKRRIGKLLFDSYQALVVAVKAWNHEEKRQEVCRFIAETAVQYPNHRGMKMKLMDLMPVEPFHGEPLAVVREPNELESSLM